jgi:hypothetical protein
MVLVKLQVTKSLYGLFDDATDGDNGDGGGVTAEDEYASPVDENSLGI